MLVTLMLAGCAGPTEPAAFEVLGFQEAGSGTATLEASSTVTYVGVDGVTLVPDGTGVESPGPDALARLQTAHDLGLAAELLVSNFDAALGDFSTAASSTLLSSAANRAAVVSSLAGFVGEQGWDGVMIDLESMTEADSDGLTALAGELRAALDPGIRLDIALMAATNDDGYRAWGYDLEALGAIVDRVTIMTYDQHGPWSDAGPIGGLEWQRAVVDALLDHVDPAQVDLGVAGYGYLWGPDGSRQVSVVEARELAGEAAVFDDAEGEWTAVLDDGTVLWWSDSRSVALRTALAHELGLGGVALWSLGLVDAVP